MDDHLLSAQLRAVAGSESHQFLDLVRLSGLNPRRDFRYADLSRADLRGQDMRAFDLSHASLRGALIVGARFNETVKPRQYREALAGVPAVLIPIGERLISARRRLQEHLGQEVFIPEAILDALVPLADAPLRRVKTEGRYLGDSSDLVRRRLSHHFKALSRTLKASGTTFVIIDPDTDFDFDILNVVLRYLRREGAKAFVFVLPQHMERDATSAPLLAARLRNLDSSLWANLAEATAGRSAHMTGKPAQALASIERARDKALNFVWAVAHATYRNGAASSHEARDIPGGTMIIEGRRRARESLTVAISRDVTDAYINRFQGAERHHILLREDLYSREAASVIAGQLGGRRTACDFSTFPQRTDLPAEYFVAAGPDASEIWNAIRLR